VRTEDPEGSSHGVGTGRNDGGDRQASPLHSQQRCACVGIRTTRARGAVRACRVPRARGLEVRARVRSRDARVRGVGHGTGAGERVCARAGPCIRALLRRVEGSSGSWIEQRRLRIDREGGGRSGLEAVHA
jgi:hypothetical protein